MVRQTVNPCSLGTGHVPGSGGGWARKMGADVAAVLAKPWDRWAKRQRASRCGSVWQVFFQERHGEPWAHVGAAAPRPHRPHDLSCKANEERS